MLKTSGLKAHFFYGKMENKEIIEKSYRILEGFIESLGYEVVLIEFVKEQIGWVLRIYIDKEGGVTIDDCVKVSELVSPILDVEDYINFPYNLEISSPGVNRPLRKKEHFNKVIGEKIKIVLEEGIEEYNNRKNYKGILKKVSEDSLTVEIDKKDYEIPLEKIKKANLVYKFK